MRGFVRVSYTFVYLRYSLLAHRFISSDFGKQFIQFMKVFIDMGLDLLHFLDPLIECLGSFF